MESKKFKGEWWSPDAPDDRVPGVVEYSPQEGEAEFFGLIGDSQPTSNLMDKSLDDFHEGFLFGETTDSEYITITDAVVIGTSYADLLNNKGIPSSQYRFTHIYEGGHFAQEPEFQQFSFGFDGLTEWFGDSRIDLEHPDDDEGDIRSKYVVKEPKEVTVQLETAKLTFFIGSGFSHSGTETVLSNSVSVNIQIDEPLTFPKFREQYIRPLKRYLALATGVPVQLTDVTGVRSEMNTINILSNIPDYAPEDRSVSHSSVLFKPDDVELENSIQSWFENESQAEYLFNFYFGTIYNSQLYLEHQFISLAVALEYYFGHQYPDYRVMDGEEYKGLRRDIVDKIPDEAGAKERIKNLLISIGNLPSFRNKLDMVAEEYEPVLDLMMDIDTTLSLATKIRHDLAHGLGRDYTPSEFADTRYRLQIIIECILLDIAGIDDETKKEILLTRYHDTQFVEVTPEAIEEN